MSNAQVWCAAWFLKWMSLFLFTAGLLVGQSPTDPCSTSRTNPSDVSLELSLENGHTTFREGEIIGLKLAFSSSTPDKYYINTRNYDRSGRLNSETFCVDPDTARDPLADYFSSGLFAFMGGGLGGENPLDQKPYSIALELNEWKSLPPGKYRLQLQSNRIMRGARNDEPGIGRVSVPVWSNVVEFEVIPANPEWQAEQLAAALSVIDSVQVPDEGARHAARVLRFLGSESASREIARRFWALNEQPYGWDLMFGLVGSPHRVATLSAMKAAIADPEHPITSEFVQTLALLEVQSNPQYQLPPYDEKHKEEWLKQRDEKTAAHKALMSEYLRELTHLLNTKSGKARAVSVNTLLMDSAGATSAGTQRLRQLLVSSWDSLPMRTRNELIQYRWEQVGGPELLPILRDIVNSPPNVGHGLDQPERGPALRHIYELSTTEGRELILREMHDNKGDIGMRVLGLLPDRELPQVEEPILAKFRVGNGNDIDYELIERYASKRALPEIKKLYEKNAGKWACVPQNALLKYFLRTNPEYGVSQIKSALSYRKDTSCYQMLFTGIGEAISNPAIERIAIDALEDRSPEVVRSAAEALQKYGSLRAEPALWRRLEQFHERWKDKAEELGYRSGSKPEVAAEEMIEYALLHAIANGQSWDCGADKLQRLKSLVLPMRQSEVDGMLRTWQAPELGLNLSWWPDGDFSYNLGYISGQSLERLQQKVSRLPAGTHLSSVMTKMERERHSAEIAQIEKAAATAGLILDIKTPR
ncbi:MAG: hypothetical protein JWO20_495 [Candidatus Angelobacter sp.]|nr:hypothetical protein [Candidatus Angelobacter sp.]